MIIQTKIPTEENSENQPNIISFSNKIELLKFTFIKLNQDFEKSIETLKQFVIFLKRLLESNKSLKTDDNFFRFLLFFYLVSENLDFRFLERISKHLFNFDLSHYDSIFDADFHRFDLRKSEMKDVDYIFQWITQNQHEITGKNYKFVEAIVREKLKNENSLIVLQEYTSNSREINQELIFESVQRIIKSVPGETSAKKTKVSKSNIMNINQSINDFLTIFKKNELISPFERLIQLGLCVLKTQFCDFSKNINCPTCQESIKNVELLDGRFVPKNR